MNTRTSSRAQWLSGIFFAVLSFLVVPGYGQGNAVRAGEVNADSTLISWIVRNVRTDAPLEDFHLDFIPNKLPVFLPKDLPAPYYDPQTPDNPVRVHGRWWWPIGGTGRVYSWNPVFGKMDRLDSTVFYGNTFGSIDFVLGDTLYSLGGYGFWRTNGQLRYFDTLSRSWNIRPLNQEIPVKERNGHWFSSTYGQLYYVNQPVTNEPISDRYNSPPEDASMVMKLNVRTGVWSVLGIAETGALEILKKSHRIAATPMGTLYLEMPPSSGKAYVLDYMNNRVLQMSPPWVRRLVRITNRPTEVAKLPAKCFAYFSDSSLHFITTEGVYDSLPLAADSYSDSGIRVYAPVSYMLESLKEWVLPAASFFLFVFALGWNIAIWRRQSSKSSPADQVQFDDVERLLIRTLRDHPEKILTTDDINSVLGTHRKNPDLQRKYRSERIKAINEKCFKLLSTSESLILTERSSDDKRVVLYRINAPLFERVEKHISQV